MPIQAEMLYAGERTVPAAVASCDLTGRLVQGKGVGVHVPKRGTATAVHAMRANAVELTLEVRHNRDGAVLVTEENNHAEPSKQAQAAGVVSQEMAGGQAACSDITWKDNGDKESDNHLWRYNRSSHPTAGSVAANYHESAVHNGVANLVSGYNDCGLRRNFKAYNRFEGDTIKGANINSEAKCAGNFPDGYSTVSWGNVTAPDVLAVACTQTTFIPGKRDEIGEADITIDKSDPWWLTDVPRSTCTARHDLEAVMTHEWGHVYGLGHAEPASEHRQQTMSPLITACSTFQRSLGRGDYAGMYNIYGPL